MPRVRYGMDLSPINISEVQSMVGVYHSLPRSRGCDAHLCLVWSNCVSGARNVRASQSVGFKPVVNKAVGFVVLAPG